MITETDLFFQTFLLYKILTTYITTYSTDYQYIFFTGIKISCV